MWSSPTLYGIPLLLICLYTSPACASLDNRVVGGIPAKLGEFPYQVSLTEFGDHFCGGALIAPNLIITAAHCLCDDELLIAEIQVAAGFIDQRNPGNGYQRRNVVKKICHEGFHALLNDNDIALAVVDQEFTLGDSVKSIALPTSSSIVLPKTCVVSGWGATAENAGMSNILYKLDVNMFSWEECNSIYEDEFSDILICAGYTEGGKDTCQGDSGGPLVCVLNGQPTLVGVVAAGEGCARPGFPGIYTPTYKFLDWIQRKEAEL